MNSPLYNYIFPSTYSGLQGSSLEEVQLAWSVLLLEGLPQLLLLAMTMTHWHAPFNTTVLDLFTTTVNVPLRQEFISRR